MSKKQTMENLLKANPKAKQQEQVIKDALDELDKLRREGVATRGYNLVPPFGEKRRGLLRARTKLTLFA
jgi:hypothetical protein